MSLNPLGKLNPENFLCWIERCEIFVGKWDKTFWLCCMFTKIHILQSLYYKRHDYQIIKMRVNIYTASLKWTRMTLTLTIKKVKIINLFCHLLFIEQLLTKQYIIFGHKIIKYYYVYSAICIIYIMLFFYTGKMG